MMQECQKQGFYSSCMFLNDVQISMDGKGCYRDNIFVKRLWGTVKYEHLYTKEFSSLKEAGKSLSVWFDWNQEQFHQNLDDLIPDEVYYQNQVVPQACLTNHVRA